MNNRSAILAKFARREASDEEQKAFKDWLRTLTPDQMEEVMDEYGALVAALPEGEIQPNDGLLAKIHREIATQEAIAPIRRLPLYRWGWAAAALLGLVLVGGYWLQHRKAADPGNAITETRTKNDIPPGKEGATLTLADGTKVLLDTLANGIVTRQGGHTVVVNNGQLAYKAITGGKNTAKLTLFNTLTTPKGRQFQLLLPDGTRVWLNAASSIRYPAEFSGTERKVEISGEAYLEVANNARQPFRVLLVNNKEEIEVLGTAFNVNAYENEKVISTTLLEGAVKAKGIVLKPGQQLQVGSLLSPSPQGPATKVIDNVATDKVMAWKNGLFDFNGMKLEDAMRQLERWYAIEVYYEKGIPDITFWGKIPRDLTLNSVLSALEKMNVHFRIQEKKLIVFP